MRVKLQCSKCKATQWVDVIDDPSVNASEPKEADPLAWEGYEEEGCQHDEEHEIVDQCYGSYHDDEVF